MTLQEFYDIALSVLAPIGGAGVIILALSSYLGKVWATRLMAKETHEHNKELEKIKSDINTAYHVFKLDKEHEYEQRKKIKEVISKNKIRIIDSAEALNHRMWNFNENHVKKWHIYNKEGADNQYYLCSFIYRILVFYSWCNSIEKDMIYLDSTIVSEKDLDFVKFLKLLPQVMCDVVLFKGLDYNPSHDTDHFFKNDFQIAVDKVKDKDGVISFDEFKKKIKDEDKDVNKFIKFISGISPDEERLRWFRLQSMHYVLLMFINTFGYDFQHTRVSKIAELKDMHKENLAIKNLEKIIIKIKLQGNPEVKAILGALNA